MLTDTCLTFETEKALPSKIRVSLQVLLPVLAILLTLATASLVWIIAKAIVGKQEEKEISETLLKRTSTLSVKIDRAMQELIRMGVNIAIDDFGTGYSSLSYLGKFPINELKIDQSFVRNLLQDAENAAIVRAIISLAQSLKLGVVAEGVETAAQVDFLKHAGCNVMQGYYFSKPLDSGAMTKLLHARHGGGGKIA